MALAPAAGLLLVARPDLLDPNFTRTVVLLCRHDAAEGTFGLVLTRPAGLSLADAGVEMDAGREEPLLLGGPVQPQALWVVHRRGDLAEEGERVSTDLWFGARPALVKELLAATPHPAEGSRALFFAGYAGWGEGQLEEELAAGAWDVVPALPEAYFEGERSTLWVDMALRARLPVVRQPEHLLRCAHS